MMPFRIRSFVAVTLLSVVATTPGLAAAPRALAADKQPDDARLGAFRTLDSYFPFQAVASKEEWNTRREAIRRRTLVATGLWPMPERTPLNAVVHGKIERPGYSVEKVFFESYPGHYVTGSLYRPTGKTGKLPGVLCPHGHWANGRFHDHGEKEVKKEIAIGAERFATSGRHPLQARCVQLARMGCIVFHYDMVGYADSVQIDHRPGVREAMNTAENWGFFSPQAELRLQSMMGLQTWNSVRALDFLLSYGVDPERIAVTGASGGGTQTFTLTAIDDRVRLAFPAVMVSTAMQGGCTCENCNYLRIDQGNIDIAAVCAPRPLGVTAADDWTKEMATKGFPDLKKLYEMLGHKDDVTLAAFVHFKHNYNAVSRVAMYNWLNKHFKLGFDDPVIEEDFQPLSKEELSVWTDKHTRPSGDNAGDAHERALLKTMTEGSNRIIQALVPKDAKSLDAFRATIGGAYDVMLGRRLASGEKIAYELRDKQDRGTYMLMTALITNEARKEQSPTLYLYPKKWNEQVVVWVHEHGKAGLLTADGMPNPQAKTLLDKGFAVAGIDLIQQGEFLKEGEQGEFARLVNYDKGKQDWQRYAGYTFGYNHPLFAQRVHDLLNFIQFVKTDKHGAKAIHLLGFGPLAGPLAAAASAQAGSTIAKTAVGTAGFRFEKLDRFDHVMFLPGAAKYLDLPGLLALIAPGQLWVSGETAETLRVVQASYRAAGKADALGIGSEKAELPEAIEWLIQ